MPEPTTLGLAALAAYLGKDGIAKILGPNRRLPSEVS